MTFNCTQETLEYMYRYLLKYVGTYRVKAEYDLSTNDFPKNQNGQLEESFEDLYIPCSRGVIKHTYLGNDILVLCFYDKITIANNTYKKIIEKYPKLDILLEEDGGDGFIYFQAKDIKKIATIIKPKTAGAKINPFSPKNLPKVEYKIPSKDLTELYSLTQSLSRTETLQFFKQANADFMKKFNKKEKQEFKDSRLGRREYIHYKGLWDSYLKFIKRRIVKQLNNNV